MAYSCVTSLIINLDLATSKPMIRDTWIEDCRTSSGMESNEAWSVHGTFQRVCVALR